MARQFSGGCLSRFAAFRFFVFLVYHAHDQNRQPLSQIGVLRVLYVFLRAPGRCAGAAFYDFFVLRVCRMWLFDNPYRRSVAFLSQHVASKSLLSAPA